MRLMLLLLLAALVGTATALQCDPETQYELNGQCCRMCGPGTSMTNLGSCAVPQCKDCANGEYQDKYTKELKCESQPYCDPNKDFEDVVHHSKTEQTTCKCRKGFHCSSDHCLFCVADQICAPGFKIYSVGNGTHDTVCQKCQEGYYSEESSSMTCKKMTECSLIEQAGTSTSDNICGADRTHWIVMGVLSPLLIAVVILILILYYKDKLRYTEVKYCFGLCRETKNEPLREIKPVEENTPVEDLEDTSILQEMVHLTENRNLVAQENGKTEILSCVSIGDSDMPVETLDSSSYGLNSSF